MITAKLMLCYDQLDCYCTRQLYFVMNPSLFPYFMIAKRFQELLIIIYLVMRT